MHIHLNAMQKNRQTFGLIAGLCGLSVGSVLNKGGCGSGVGSIWKIKCGCGSGVG